MTVQHHGRQILLHGLLLAMSGLLWGLAVPETPHPQLANAWWGTAQMLPIAAGQAGATGGEPWQELTVTVAHSVAGSGLLVAWGVLVIGFVRAPSTAAART